MARKKSKTDPKQGPPFQFRPGAELESLVGAFASQHGLAVNEACKELVALAVTAMDARYYALMRQLAEAMGGANAFVRACVHVHGRVEGAALADPKYRYEPGRARMIVKVVEEFVEAKGRRLSEDSLNFLPEEHSQYAEVEMPEPSRQKVSTGRTKPKVVQRESEEGHPREPEGEAGEGQGWSPFGPEEEERPRVRP